MFSTSFIRRSARLILPALLGCFALLPGRVIVAAPAVPALQPAIRAEELVGRGAGRRGFPPIQDVDRASPGQVNHQEAAAADAGGLGLDDVERELNRHGGIDGVSAAPEDGGAGLGGQGMRGADEAAAGRGTGCGGDRGLLGARWGGARPTC